MDVYLTDREALKPPVNPRLPISPEPPAKREEAESDAFGRSVPVAACDPTNELCRVESDWDLGIMFRAAEEFSQIWLPCPEKLRTAPLGVVPRLPLKVWKPPILFGEPA